MVLSLAIATVLILAALAAQGLWLDFLLRRFGGFAKRIVTLLPRSGRAFVMAFYALACLPPHIAAITLWALFYVYGAGAGQEDAVLEAAFYFSAATHGTTGFGDITLNAPWRVLSALQGVGGLLMLAWNTAFLFEVHSRLYRPAPRERA